MRFVSGDGFVLDDIYITSVSTQVFHPDGDLDKLRISSTFSVKPLAVDEILWAAFCPNVTMGPKMRINRRINGACQVQPLRLERGVREVVATDEPDWGPVLDEFDRVRNDFVAAHPQPADYAAVLEEGSHDGIAPSRTRTRMVTALIAAGRNGDAARVADEAIARGERGGMSSTVDVLKYLAAYARGPQVYAAFAASLIPTHDYQVLSDSQRDVSVDLCREHHRGVMRRDLQSMDGADPWAVTLSIRPAGGAAQDETMVRYLQTAGSAEMLTVEIRQAGGTEMGAVSVRSVVGHLHSGPSAPRDVEIVLPRSTEWITRHEVFTADEVADLFDRYYRTDTIGDGYTFRPVEGYTADGGYVYPKVT
ncbi:hypothetical protein ACNQR7_31140 [Mycolicibacterium senegalense]|uniref:hypothetical protein n=1 Tax=Mycolicibacterium senegalense TaxID=1796 RepID=UPI003AAE35A4